MFGDGWYFDSIDTGEAAAHEYAAARLDGSPTPLRGAIGDPTDLVRRPANMAISALTVRQDPAGDQFLLHWRDPAKVGHAGGLYQVVPVGVFQSSEPDVTHTGGTRATGTFVSQGAPEFHSTRGHRQSDFDLWRFMLREYAEELLGEPEVEAPDYETWPFAKAMTAALDAGGITADVLGLGVDPLTFATDLLVRVVIDAPVFDELFGARVAVNDEGAVSMRPFTHEAIEGLPMQAAGAALVRLALDAGEDDDRQQREHAADDRDECVAAQLNSTPAPRLASADEPHTTASTAPCSWMRRSSGSSRLRIAEPPTNTRFQP